MFHPPHTPVVLLYSSDKNSLTNLEDWEYPS